MFAIFMIPEGTAARCTTQDERSISESTLKPLENVPAEEASKYITSPSERAAATHASKKNAVIQFLEICAWCLGEMPELDVKRQS